MTAPRWPDVYAGLLALLPTIPAFANVAIFDGQPISNDSPPQWFTVGYATDDGAGQFVQVHDPSGYATQEQGDIRCHVAANVGDTDASITRNQAFALVGALQSAIEKDQTLGGHLPNGSVVNLSTQVMSVQNEMGSASSLLVTVHYQTLTFY